MPYADQPYESKSEEEMDNDSYLEDDIPIEVDSDSSAALSITDEDFETTDPVKIDQALQLIVQGLCQAADGYETLRNILPTVLVTDVAGIVQIAPTPYLQPMSNATIQALQTLDEENLINQACLAEFEKEISQAALMRKYGIGQDRLYKVIHGKIHLGGTQYQTLKKEDSTKSEVKSEPSLDVPTPRPKGKVGEKCPERSRSQNATTTNNNTKTQSFSGLSKHPKVKYSRKACHHECRQSLFTFIFIMTICIQFLLPFSL